VYWNKLVINSNKLVINSNKLVINSNKCETAAFLTIIFASLISPLFLITSVLAFDLSEIDGDDNHGNNQVIRGWSDSNLPVPYIMVNGNFPDGISSVQWTDAVTNAFQSWEDVQNSKIAFRFETGTGIVGNKVNLTSPEIPATYYSQRGPNFPSGNGAPDDAGTYNVISAITNWQDFGFSQDALAVTVTLFTLQDRFIISADMFINNDGTSVEWSTDPSGESGKFDLQYVITHEAGHFIGIGHPTSTGRENTTMYFEAPPNATEKRLLHTDDENAAVYLYPGQTSFVTEPQLITPDNNLWGLRDPVTGQWTNTTPQSGGISGSNNEGSSSGGGCSLSSVNTHVPAFFLPYLFLLILISTPKFVVSSIEPID